MNLFPTITVGVVTVEWFDYKEKKELEISFHDINAWAAKWYEQNLSQNPEHLQLLADRWHDHSRRKAHQSRGVVIGDLDHARRPRPA